MKNLKAKILIFSFALLFTAGCATVTDANLEIPEDKSTSFEISETNDAVWDTRNGDDMNPIIERPKTGTSMD